MERIRLLGGNITCIVISPDPGLPGSRVVLPDQLVGRVVDIGSSIVVRIFVDLFGDSEKLDFAGVLKNAEMQKETVSFFWEE